MHPPEPLPLCCDLDGTLIAGNSLDQSCLQLFLTQPRLCLRLLPALRHGQDQLWARLAEHRRLPNAQLLPYRPAIVEFLRQQHAQRPLILVTGAHHELAQAISQHLGLFAAAYGSTPGTHLVGQAKARFLSETFPAGFDYLGDSPADRPVWQAARQPLAVLHDQRTRSLFQRLFPQGQIVLSLSSWFPGALLRAMRPLQWTKNFLVFAPLLLAHHWNRPDELLRAALAALAFSLAGSSVYLFNDLNDIEADRVHPRKRRRPLASGLLPLRAGVVFAPVLLLLAVALAATLSPKLALLLLLYTTASGAYSVSLKQVAVLDVILLALFYTARLFAGSLATSIPLSFWTLIFSVFLFFSLALAKRFAETRRLLDQGVEQASRRGYLAADHQVLLSLGSSAGVLSVLILGLYINTPDIRGLYRSPEILWLISPALLGWISHLWLAASRGHLEEDPVVFALRDTGSRLVAAFVLAIFFAAVYLG